MNKSYMHTSESDAFRSFSICFVDVFINFIMYHLVSHLQFCFLFNFEKQHKTSKRDYMQTFSTLNVE